MSLMHSILMRFAAKTSLVLVLSLSLAACQSDSNDQVASGDESPADGGDSGSEDGGSDGGGDGPVTPSAPAAPVVTPSYDDWTLTFNWPTVPDATFYRVFEDPDGVSGFSQIGPDLTTNTYTNNISLTERNGARYLVSACNTLGCADSDEVTLDALDSGITPIAVSGDSAPGIGGGAVLSDAIGLEMTFDTNQLGTIAIKGATNQTDSGGTLRDGIFRHTTSGGLTLVQADDEPLPEDDGIYSGFLQVLVGNSNQIIFNGILKPQNAGSPGGIVDGLNNEVLLRNTAGTTELLAREGQPARNGTLFPTLDADDIYFTSNIQGNRIFASLSIDGAGGVTFKPGSNTDAFNAIDDSFYPAGSALWTITGVGQKFQSLKAGESQLPNNLEPNFFGFLPFDQNPAGQLAFGLSLRNADGTLPPDSSNSGVYVRNVDGSFSEAVRETGGSARDNIGDLGSASVQIADNGEVFYFAERDVAGTANRGLYTNSVDGSDFTKIVRRDQAFLLNDGSIQEITDFIGGNGSFDVGDNDAVAFLINAGVLSQEDALMVWTNSGTTTSVQKYFQEGDPVRGLPDATGVDLDVVSLSPAPRLRFGRDFWAVFQADDELDINNKRRLLLASSPSGYTRVIVRERQNFAVDGVDYGVVTEILDFKMSSPAEMVMSLRFDRDGVFELGDPPDGKNGIFRVTLCSPSEPC